mgnify:CR=1 FL=1
MRFPPRFPRFAVVPFVLLIASLTARMKAAEEQPNILWIVSEDNSPWLGSYGDELATTPRLDALAAESIRYTRAYSNAPVCAPSRNALITGAYPIAYGTEHMRSTYKMPADIRFYPEYLREVGYYTTNNAKKDYNIVERKGVWDESSRKASWRNRPSKDTPFFHMQSHGESHESSLHSRSTRISRLSRTNMHFFGTLTNGLPRSTKARAVAGTQFAGSAGYEKAPFQATREAPGEDLRSGREGPQPGSSLRGRRAGP